MAATLKQIAAMTGLSIPTVHQILNGYNVPFAEATRKRVLAAAAEVDYRPNITAQSLVRQRSFLVGVLFYGANYGIVTQFMRGVQGTMKANKCSPVFLTHDSVAEELENLESVLARRVDGVIVNAAIDSDGTTNAKRLSDVHHGGLPMVEVFGRFIPGVPKVTLDYRAAGRLATESAVARGHQKIALLIREQYRETDPGQIGGRFWTASEFWRGHQAVMKSAGLKTHVQEYPVVLDDMHKNVHFLGASQTVSSLFDNPKTAPTALVCYSTDAAEAAIRYFEGRNDSSGQVLTVIACGSLQPTVSKRVEVVSLPMAVIEAGQAAGSALFESLAGERVKDVALSPSAG